MSTRLKVDEDLPVEVAVLLRRAGHDTATVLEQGLRGASDEAVWQHAQRERRCLFTADKDFAGAALRHGGPHTGVVLLRLPRESRAGYVHLAQLLVETFDFEAVPNAIVVVTPTAIRIHRPR